MASSRPFKVGDIVLITGSTRTGEVRYCGKASFAKDRVVVGLRLHRKRSTSDCDGSYKNERHFTCTAGYGLYALAADVEPLPPGALLDTDEGMLPREKVYEAPVSARRGGAARRGGRAAAGGRQRLGAHGQVVTDEAKEDAASVASGPSSAPSAGGRGGRAAVARRPPMGARAASVPSGAGAGAAAEEDSRSVVSSASDDRRERRSVDGRDGFNLEEELASVVGLASVKQKLRSLRNRAEVMRRRREVGIIEDSSWHSLFVGPGSGKQEVASLLARTLHAHGVLSSPRLLVASRRDLVAARTEDTVKATEELLKKARGGLLFIKDAHTILQPVAPAAGGAAPQDDYYGSVAWGQLQKELARDASEHRKRLEQQQEAKERGGAAGPRGRGRRGAAAASPLSKTAHVPLVVVLAGDDAGLRKAVTAMGDASALFATTFEFEDYGVEELVQVLRRVVKKRKFCLDPGLDDAQLADVLRASMRVGGKKNAEIVEDLVDEAIQRQTDRVFTANTISKGSLTTLVAEDFNTRSGGAAGSQADAYGAAGEGKAGEEEDADAILASLDDIIGLEGVKDHIRSLHAQLLLDQRRRSAGMPSKTAATLHLIFRGNPGTGKTSVARVVAALLRAMGILRRGHLVEVDRAKLVAGYSGQTAIKTTEVVNSALGGVLFVDEAYALVSDERDTFGREALDSLIKLVEDHRDDLVVILAGYHEEMDSLLAKNPGVRSRFPIVIDFDDYTEVELMEIAESMLRKEMFELTTEAREVLQMQFEALASVHDRQNGNGRAVRNLLEAAKRRQALRLVDRKRGGVEPTPDDLRTLTASDFGKEG